MVEKFAAKAGKFPVPRQHDFCLSDGLLRKASDLSFGVMEILAPYRQADVTGTLPVKH